jgi:hypothetical protein
MIFRQMIKGRDDFAVGEITRGAEDDRRGGGKLLRRAGDHVRAGGILDNDGHGDEG